MNGKDPVGLRAIVVVVVVVALSLCAVWHPSVGSHTLFRE